MQMRMIIRRFEQPDTQIDLNNNAAYITSDGFTRPLNASDDLRFKTLCSLFSLSKSWRSTKQDHSRYEIYLKDSKTENLYFFNDNLPDNFPLFMAYISKLVGDSYE